MTGRVTLSIPGTPPSFNAVGLRSHWAVGQRHKKQWEQWLFYAIWEVGLKKGIRRIDAKATIRFKQRRRRDEGNFRPLLEKALGDALVGNGYLPDDTPEHYRFGRVELVAPVEKPETILVLDYEG